MTDDTKSAKSAASPDYEAMARACESAAGAHVWPSVEAQLLAAARTFRALAASRSDVIAALESMAKQDAFMKVAFVLTAAATQLRSSPDLSAVRAEARRDVFDEIGHALAGLEIERASIEDALRAVAAIRARLLSPAAEAKPKGG